MSFPYDDGYFASAFADKNFINVYDGINKKKAYGLELPANIRDLSFLSNGNLLSVSENAKVIEHQNFGTSGYQQVIVVDFKTKIARNIKMTPKSLTAISGDGKEVVSLLGKNCSILLR